jgi:hypothetical protein
METKTVSRNSWHYKVATFLDRSYEEPRLDFCSYVRGFLKTMVGVAFMAVVACAVVVAVSVAVWWVSNFIAWTAYLLIEGWVEMHEYAVIGAILTGCGAVFGAYQLGMKAAPVVAVHQPDFLRDAWRSFHDKTCFRLRITD